MSTVVERALPILLALVTGSVLAAAAPADAPEYVIQPGDQLGIKFYYNPALNEEVIVRPDGRISLQLIEEIVAAGLTPSALAQRLRDMYSREMEKPEIAVIVRTFSAQKVYVDGEVGRPGELPLDGPLTLRQALAEAGGITDRGRLRDIVVIRRNPDGSASPVRVDVRGPGRTPHVQDVQLVASDVVYVSRKAITNVNIFIDQWMRRNLPISVTLGYRYVLAD